MLMENAQHISRMKSKRTSTKYRNSSQNIVGKFCRKNVLQFQAQFGEVLRKNPYNAFIPTYCCNHIRINSIKTTSNI